MTTPRTIDGISILPATLRRIANRNIRVLWNCYTQNDTMKHDYWFDLVDGFNQEFVHCIHVEGDTVADVAQQLRDNLMFIERCEPGCGCGI